MLPLGLKVYLGRNTLMQVEIISQTDSHFNKPECDTAVLTYLWILIYCKFRSHVFTGASVADLVIQYSKIILKPTLTTSIWIFKYKSINIPTLCTFQGQIYVRCCQFLAWCLWSGGSNQIYVPQWKIHRYLNCYTKAIKQFKFIYTALFRERTI